jgi:hypothetical protein
VNEPIDCSFPDPASEGYRIKGVFLDWGVKGGDTIGICKDAYGRVYLVKPNFIVFNREGRKE